MTVAQMQLEMSNAEYVGWCMYHARRAQDMELEMRKGGWHG